MKEREAEETRLAVGALVTAAVLLLVAWAIPAVVVAVWQSQSLRCPAGKAIVGVGPHRQ